jgi:hypothetical protein
MRNIILIGCLLIGAVLLYIIWPSHSHAPDGHGHSHGSAAQQPAASPDSIIHDNIDSQ